MPQERIPPMKNYFSGILLLLLTLFFSPLAHGRNLDIDVKDFTCDGGKYYLRFGVINHYTYDRNPTLAFKLVQGDRVLNCKTVDLYVPAGADGSNVQELYFDLGCEEEVVSLQFRVFERRDRNRVGVWLADCPD
jgi:hypothetical protein